MRPFRPVLLATATLATTTLATTTLATLAVFAVFAVAACGGGKPAPQQEATSGGDTFPVTVGTVTLDKRPTHVVSLSPTATEMLFAVGAGGQVTAVDSLSNYPEDAPKTDLSAFKPNAEAIAAKNPDLVVLSNDTNKIVDQLTKLRIPVYLAPAARTLDDTYRQLADIGKLTGHTKEGADAAKRIKDDVADLVKDVPKRTKPLKYYYELDQQLFSVTSKTFIGSLFSMVGLENVADPADASGAAGGYPQLSAESIIKANPDLIFLADTKCCQQSAETVNKRPGWGNIIAVENGKVFPLDDDIASRWGPRVVDLLHTIVDATR
jgi:iron complex transport system substrate-binding protein